MLLILLFSIQGVYTWQLRTYGDHSSYYITALCTSAEYAYPSVITPSDIPLGTRHAPQPKTGRTL